MDQDPFAPFETARLHLRCVAQCDAAATSALMTPDVSRWVAYWPVPFNVADATARIEAMRRLAFAGDALPFAIMEKRSGQLAGWAMINRDATNRRRATIGYWLGTMYQRQGYMTEIGPRLIAAGFAMHDVDVIEAAAQVENTGSFAIMESCGMTPTGEAMIHAPARARDELCRVYEITRDQFVIQ